MTQEGIEALREMVYAANNTPINQMSCFVCDHFSVFKKYMQCYCNFHHYSLLDAHRSVCFNFKPLRKEQKIMTREEEDE